MPGERRQKSLAPSVSELTDHDFAALSIWESAMHCSRALYKSAAFGKAQRSHSDAGVQKSEASDDAVRRTVLTPTKCVAFYIPKHYTLRTRLAWKFLGDLNHEEVGSPPKVVCAYTMSSGGVDLIAAQLKRTAEFCGVQTPNICVALWCALVVCLCHTAPLLSFRQLGLQVLFPITAAVKRWAMLSPTAHEI